MKKIITITFFCLIFLIGCQPREIMLEDIRLEDGLRETTNTSTPQYLYFTMINKENESANCSVEFNLISNNITNTKTYFIDELPARSKNPILLKFDMPFGISSFDLTPNCTFNQ